jgi:hypothetical protein
MQSPAKTVRRAVSRAIRRVRFGRLRYVVVVSYSRTGSTLLQGVLMAAPHVLVRGEQGGTITHLKNWYDELCRYQSKFAGRYELSRRHPFFGIGGFRRDAALRRIRLLLLETLLRPTSDTAVVGFKENSWADDVEGTLTFVRNVFPGVRFIVNTRDLDAVATSGFWVRRPDAEQTVRARHERILAAASKFGDEVYYVHYDDWVEDPEQLRGLFQWLGLRYDADRIAAVMRQPHSYANRSVAHLDEQAAATPHPTAARRAPSAAVATAWAAVTAAQVAAVVTAAAGVGPFAD